MTSLLRELESPTKRERLIIGIILPVFVVGALIFFGLAVYQNYSPQLTEIQCQIAKSECGLTTRIVIDTLSNMTCEVKENEQWIQICQTNQCDKACVLV